MLIGLGGLMMASFLARRFELYGTSWMLENFWSFWVLALISLSLAIINLFPFLPLDGGHVFWALAEKVLGRRIPFSVMERASAMGFVLIIIVFVVVVLAGTLFSLLRSTRTGMPSKDVLERAQRRARKLESEEEKHD